jgi:hypothetical protein
MKAAIRGKQSVLVAALRKNQLKELVKAERRVQQAPARPYDYGPLLASLARTVPADPLILR